MVQFKDGTIMANIAPKDMQIPIAYALNFPCRLTNQLEKLDLFNIGTLRFEKPDLNKFRCLKLAYEAIEAGHSAQVVLNAANEVAVKSFLERKIVYTDIPKTIEMTLEKFQTVTLNSIDEILALDNNVRRSIIK
jgi:1-deoxy-D-xylulose-5-phosphate reductoisomerase